MLSLPVNRALRCTFAILVLSALTACSAEVSAGSEGTVIQWSGATRFWAIGCPVAGMVVGLLLTRSKRRGVEGWVLLVIAALAAAAGAFMSSDRIVITVDEIYDHCGFPWNRQKRGFRFADVERVMLQEVRQTGQNPHTRTIWNLKRRDGSQYSFDPGDLWEVAFESIHEHLKRAGVRVGDDPARFGLASDDPRIVTLANGATYRFDSDRPGDRLSALVYGGALWDMTSESTGRPLRESRTRADGCLGRWHHTVSDGSRSLTVVMEFRDDGTFSYDVRGQGLGGVCTGKYRCSERELTLEMAGSVLSVMF
jgi:hypothetical protein